MAPVPRVAENSEWVAKFANPVPPGKLWSQGFMGKRLMESEFIPNGVAAIFCRRFGRPLFQVWSWSARHDLSPSVRVRIPPVAHFRCVSFDHMETKLPQYACAEKRLSQASTRGNSESEFCEFRKNVEKFKEKTRMKCLIGDVKTALLPILPVFA
jgi:hypothetical protein